MGHLLEELNIHLIVFRIIICLTLFLFYFDSISSFILLLVFIMLLLNVSFLSLNIIKINKLTYYSLVGFDLVICYLLIAKTGQLYSPFIMYSFTSLALLNLYFKGLKFYLFAFIYMFICVNLNLNMFPQLLLSNVLQFQWIIIVLAFISVNFLTNHFYKKFNLWYFNLLLINTSIHKLDDMVDRDLISKHIERLLKRIFRYRQGYFCWFNEVNIYNHWQKKLYINQLNKLNYQVRAKKGEIKLINQTGQIETFYFFPVYRKGKGNEGFFLIEKNVYWYEVIYLNVLSNFLISIIKNIELKQQMTHSLNKEIRRKLAQEMHDSVAQQLFFLSTQLFQVKQYTIECTTCTVSKQLDQLLSDMEAQIQQCHRDVREHIHYLIQGKEDHNIFDAIQNLINKLNKKSINIDFVTKGRLSEESFEVNETLYRVTEEALNNIIKHANAKNVIIILDVTILQWTLKIIDDGIGIQKEENIKSLGLKGMRERVSKVHGELFIRSKQKEGTEIIAIIPRKGVEAIG